ncbi:MAG: D-2-hydroxyacid dehydrogenase [Sulfurospirillaceae bacterium]|nr:D-2-hydroxyacid dehydrogenase [Sulfurospirillaceae bacterium]MDD3462049.1 D-2-hydroxyacid dehydrogenase [Sulfurospirillaceae bacterium]
MKIVILDAKTLGKDIDLSVFKQFGEVEVFETTSKEKCIESIGDAKIVLTNKVVIDAKTMDACPNMGLICVTATGMNNIDLEYAKKRGIVVKNVAGYSTFSVAQTTFTLALYLIGQSSYYDNYVKSKEWSKNDIFTHLDRPVCEIKGKKWGIVGFGTIGKEVAKIAEAFGAQVVYFSTSGVNNDSNYSRVELNEMLSSCDIVSIHSPLNDKTKGLIGEKELSLMKKGALLLNLGRGSIVDEHALANAIDKQEIYAGLDVTTVEPIEQDNPLLNVKHKERLVIFPHVAWASVEARQRLVEMVANNIQSYMETM